MDITGARSVKIRIRRTGLYGCLKKKKRKNKQEILFWKQARKLLIDGYGCNCNPKDFHKSCAECRAGEMVRFIDEHIDLLKWSDKTDTPKKLLISISKSK